MWQIETASEVDNHEIIGSLDRLSDNSVAALRIPHVYTTEEVDSIVANVDLQGVLWYPGFEHKQGRIGISATEYVSKEDGKNAYFALEAEASVVRDRIFPGELDPVKKMIDIFSQGLDTSIAEEPSLDNAKYFTGLIRAMVQESSTHFDFAPQQLPGWQVARSQAQFAVITYLQMPEVGGGLTVYKRPWEPSDEEFNMDTAEKGPNGFDKEFLNDDESITIVPNAGEMIVINSRNFHKVEGIISLVARYSINSFMSLIDNKLYLWN